MDNQSSAVQCALWYTIATQWTLSEHPKYNQRWPGLPCQKAATTLPNTGVIAILKWESVDLSINQGSTMSGAWKPTLVDSQYSCTLHNSCKALNFQVLIHKTCKKKSRFGLRAWDGGKVRLGRGTYDQMMTGWHISFPDKVLLTSRAWMAETEWVSNADWDDRQTSDEDAKLQPAWTRWLTTSASQIALNTLMPREGIRELVRLDVLGIGPDVAHIGTMCLWVPTYEVLNKTCGVLCMARNCNCWEATYYHKKFGFSAIRRISSQQGQRYTRARHHASKICSCEYSYIGIKMVLCIVRKAVPVGRSMASRKFWRALVQWKHDCPCFIYFWEVRMTVEGLAYLMLRKNRTINTRKRMISIMVRLKMETFFLQRSILKGVKALLQRLRHQLESKWGSTLAVRYIWDGCLWTTMSMLCNAKIDFLISTWLDSLMYNAAKSRWFPGVTDSNSSSHAVWFDVQSHFLQARARQLENQEGQHLDAVQRQRKLMSWQVWPIKYKYKFTMTSHSHLLTFRSIKWNWRASLSL